MGKLDGRVAAITSGSTGIGRGIAEGFLAEGAKVVLNGRNADKGAKALEEMGAGDNGFFVQGDATVREDIDKLIDGAVEHFGRIDILVNNAGGLIKTAPVMDLSDEDWDYAIRWNLYSAFWGTPQGAEPHGPAGLRPHHQHLLGRGQARQARHPRLRRVQARDERPDQGGGQGGRHHGRHLQRDLPRPGADRGRR